MKEPDDQANPPATTAAKEEATEAPPVAALQQVRERSPSQGRGGPVVSFMEAQQKRAVGASRGNMIQPDLLAEAMREAEVNRNAAIQGTMPNVPTQSAASRRNRSHSEEEAIVENLQLRPPEWAEEAEEISLKIRKLKEQLPALRGDAQQEALRDLEAGTTSLAGLVARAQEEHVKVLEENALHKRAAVETASATSEVHPSLSTPPPAIRQPRASACMPSGSPWRNLSRTLHKV